MLTLYTAPGACSFATHIALAEADAPYTLRFVDTAAGEQSRPDYLALNPLGRVPALVTEDGTLTETMALLVYVAQRFPAADLAPLADPVAFAKMMAFNAYLATTVHVAHAHKMRGHRWVDDEAAMEAMRRKVPETMTAAFQLIEDGFTGPFAMGEAHSVADGYLFTLGRWLARDEVDIAIFPKVAAHHAMIAERPAVKRALAEEAALPEQRTGAQEPA